MLAKRKKGLENKHVLYVLQFGNCKIHNGHFGASVMVEKQGHSGIFHFIMFEFATQKHERKGR